MAGDTTGGDTIVQISQRAKAEGDSFRAKVFRRARSGAMLPEALLTVDGVTVEHLANVEAWLPRIAGGGQYIIHAYHHSDLARAIGQAIQVQINGEPRDLDFTAIRNPGWTGPREIIFPKPEDLARQAQAHFQPSYSASSPGASGNIAAPQTLPGANQNPGATVHSTVEYWQAQAEAERRARIEDRHKADMERVRDENRLAMRELEAKIAATQKVEPRQDPITAIAAIIAPLVPMLTQLVQSGNEMRLFMMKQQQEASTHQLEFITKILDRKTEETPMTKVLSSMVESVTTMMDMQHNAFERAIQTAQGDREPMPMKIIGEVTKGLTALAAAAQAPKHPAPTPRVLPARRPVPVPAPEAQQTEPEPQPTPEPEPTPTPEPKPVPEGLPVVEKFVALIKSKVDSAMVAADFIASVQTDGELQRAIRAVGGNPLDLFAPYLAKWASEDPSNAVYIQSVVINMQQIMVDNQAAGEIGDEEEEDLDEETTEPAGEAA